MLTGNKNTDYEVLYNLDDYNLGNMCQVNQYTRELCANDVFWMNRTLRRFTPIFGTVEAIKNYKEQNNFNTWRKYYIDLVNFMENFYQVPNKNINRDDHSKIAHYITEKTEKYAYCYETSKSDCPLDWLKQDFIDLNQMLDSILNQDKEVEQKRELVLKIFNIPHFKINEVNIETFYNTFGLEAINILNKNSKDIRKAILRNLLIVPGDDTLLSFEKVFPYIETHDEILEVLFDIIKQGYGIEKTDINLFLEYAVKKGANKQDIEKYFESNKGFGKSLEDYEEESYEESMSIVKKYIKKMKNSKNDKLDAIIKKLQTKKYSDKVYTKILKLLE